ncbi:hypothetical protein [Cesiribacter andamanensis]|uniref:hypothetical protein n=1 Tax=Cesiribacter andamanensis TaxID=649507 RepID=UPI000590DC3A|nr:hypothetical protein [Cesiribacter andamanensis]
MYAYTSIGIDDAQIYFVYFRNFAEGHGFVYNTGGERVEGFTSLLWTLLGAGAYAISPLNFPYFLLLLNGLLVGGTLLLIDRGMRLLGGQAWTTLAIICFLGYSVLTPGYLDWMLISLMETGLWAFLLTAAVVSLLYLQTDQRYVYALSALLALLVLTRPESMLWGIYFIVMVVLTYSLQIRKLQFRPVSLMAGAFVAALVGLVVFRLSYFGYPLPNTYYAKMSGDLFYNLFQGGRYLFLSMVQLPMFWFFLIISLVSLVLLVPKLGWHRPAPEPLSKACAFQLVLAGTTFLSFMIPLYTGGDHFGMGRMLQPLVPVYFMMIFNIPFWKEATGIHFKKARTLAMGGMVLVVFPLFYFSAEVPLHRVPEQKTPISDEILVARIGRADAEKLNRLFAPLATMPAVGVSAAGGFAWAYKGYTFDMLGLNSTAMAHSDSEREGVRKNHASFDVNTLLEIKPPVFHGYSHGSAVVARFHQQEEEAFHPLSQQGFKDLFVNEIFKGVFFDPQFQQTYIPAVIRHPQVPGLIYQAYFLKSYLPELEQAGYRVRLLSMADVRKGFEPVLE